MEKEENKRKINKFKIINGKFIKKKKINPFAVRSFCTSKVGGS